MPELLARDVIAQRERASQLREQQAHSRERQYLNILGELGIRGRQRKMFLKWMRRKGQDNFCDTSATDAREILASAVDKWHVERGFTLV